MRIPELRSLVVELLHGFPDVTVREAWLNQQAMLWECEPSAVLSLLAMGRTLPREPFALVPVLPSGHRPDDYWEILDVTLLTARPVYLLQSGQAPTGHRSWVDTVEALCGLLDELQAPIPALPDRGDDPEEWAYRATSALILEIAGRLTTDRSATAIACALIWKVLGADVDAGKLPVPRVVHDPIDGWHRMLDILVSAQSAAATVLTVLAVEGGGREVRSLSLIKEG